MKYTVLWVMKIVLGVMKYIFRDDELHSFGGDENTALRVLKYTVLG